MATRTVQILGFAYGSSPASVTATVNGVEVFDGTVPTDDQPVPSLPDLELTPLQQVLFTFEIDRNFSGTVPMTCTVNNGTVVFGSILANYSTMINPVFSQEQLDILEDPTSTVEQKIAVYSAVANPPFSAEDLAILENPSTPPEEKELLLAAHGCSYEVNSGPDTFVSIDNTDPRNTVIINGVVQVLDPRDLPGTWWWTVSTGSVLAYDLEVDPTVA